MTFYCTLSGAKRINLAGTTTDDAVLFAFLQVAAQRIEDYCGQNFDVRLESHAFNAEVGSLEPRLFLDDRPLLELVSLTNGNGESLAATNYTLLPLYRYPKEYIRLNSGVYWRGPDDTASTGCNYAPTATTLAAYAADAILTTGYYGFVRHYANCWIALSAAVDGAHTASTTTLVLDAAPGALVDAGTVLRITKGTETEQVAVVAPLSGASAATSLTVERGYNNTTALALVGGETVEVFKQDTIVELAAQKTAVAMYQGRNNPSGDRVVLPNGIDVPVPDTLPRDVKAMLGYPYRNKRGGF